MARRIVARAVAAKLPIRWVCADSGYGRDPKLRRWCATQGLSFVMAVPVDLPLSTAPAASPHVREAGDLIGRLPRDSWQYRSAGDGTKGQRGYEWALVAVTVKGEKPAPGFAHHILLRRNLHDHNDIELFLVHAPTQTTLADMVAAAGLRWKIEENNEHSKDLLGLDQYQTRKWTPTFRHITTCMLANSPRIPRRHPGHPGKSPHVHTRQTTELRIGYSVNEIRHLLTRTVWTAVNHIEHVLSWSAQRLTHQTRAMISHYRRRGDPIPQHVLRI